MSKITNEYKLYSTSFTEGNSITSFGNEIKSPLVIENDIFETWDGAKFLKIFSHDIRSDGTMFPDKATSTTQQNFTIDQINRFSRLKDIPLFKGTNNKFEFMLTYPDKSLLPAEYIELDYITNPGGAYIDTGVKSNQINRAILDFSINTLESDRYVLGTRSSSSNYYKTYCSMWLVDSDYKLFYQYHNGGRQYFKIVTTNTRYITDTTLNDDSQNVSVTTSPATTTDKLSTTTNGDVFATNLDGVNCYLFCWNGYGVLRPEIGMKANLYSCKLYSGSTLVRDFKPCYRKEDNVVGLYDLITQEFYSSVSSTAFTKGHELKINRWRQTANPLEITADATQTATTMGYEPVWIHWTNNWLYGMGLSPSTATFLDCEAGHKNWFGAIGQSAYTYSSGGVNGFPVPDGSASRFCELYVRIDNINFKGFGSVRNTQGLFMNEFIEE